jgi:nitrite reductase (NADH) large subunit
LLAQLCDQPIGRSDAAAGRMTLLVCSMLVLVAAALYLALAPIAFAASVQVSLRAIDRLFRDGELKQWTGFGLLGVAALGGLLSLRKRTGRPKLGAYGGYRALHAVVGLLALLALGAHTGMRFGDNLNQLLMSAFTLLCAVGAVAGLSAALEVTPGSDLKSMWSRAPGRR